MPGKSIPMGKSRPADKPYATVVAAGGWEWRILRAYVSNPDKPFARVFAAVNNPFNPTGDLGDTYWADIRGVVIQLDPEVSPDAFPVHLRLSAQLADDLNKADDVNRIGQAMARDGLI